MFIVNLMYYLNFILLLFDAPLYKFIHDIVIFDPLYILFYFEFFFFFYISVFQTTRMF